MQDLGRSAVTADAQEGAMQGRFVLGGRGCGRAGVRLDSSELNGLAEGNVPCGRALGDLQVPQAAPEGGAGGERRLMDSI